VKASSRARLARWGGGKGGARLLDRAGADRPHAFDFCSNPDMLIVHRGVDVAAADFSTSIHRFIIALPDTRERRQHIAHVEGSRAFRLARIKA
jgi:hypothetical protein